MKIQWQVVAIVGVLVGTIALVTIVYTVVQQLLGRENLDENVLNGLLFSLFGLAVLVIVAPTVIRLYEETAEQPRDTEAEEWTTRLRTLVTVSLTIVLLVFALAWFFSSEKLLVTAGGNATSLNPFVQSFMDLYKIVVAFYFPTAAAQSIAKNWRQKTSPEGSPR